MPSEKHGINWQQIIVITKKHVNKTHRCAICYQGHSFAHMQLHNFMFGEAWTQTHVQMRKQFVNIRFIITLPSVAHTRKRIKNFKGNKWELSIVNCSLCHNENIKHDAIFGTCFSYAFYCPSETDLYSILIWEMLRATFKWNSFNLPLKTKMSMWHKRLQTTADRDLVKDSMTVLRKHIMQRTIFKIRLIDFWKKRSEWKKGLNIHKCLFGIFRLPFNFYNHPVMKNHYSIHLNIVFMFLSI